MTARFRGLLPALLLLTLSGTVSAQDDLATRVAEALERGERQHALWKGSWSAIHGVGLAYNAYQSSEASRSATRFDARVGAAKSALALGAVALTPSPYTDQRAAVAAGEVRRRELPYAIDRVSRREAEDRAPRNRLPGTAVNLLGGLIIAVGDNRPADGAISFATGMLSTGLQWFTRPQPVSRARADGSLGAAAAHRDVQITVLPGGGMASLRMAW